MNREVFLKIMDDETSGSKLGALADDNAFLGLQIIRKYLPKKGIEGADHDVIYSVGIDELIEASITEEDINELQALNWMVNDEEYLACFV